jgi:hypothetical protein
VFALPDAVTGFSHRKFGLDARFAMRTAVSLAIILAATDLVAFAVYCWMDRTDYRVAYQIVGNRAQPLTDGIVAAMPFVVLLGYLIAIQYQPDLGNRVRRFSIRTMLLSIASVAVLIALWQAIPIEHAFVAICVFFSAWMIPISSYGFDLSHRLRGAVVAAIIGLLLAFAVFMWLDQPVPRE